MVAEVCYTDFSSQFRLWKRERSRSYVTDEKGEKGRKGRANNKSNHFKTASEYTGVAGWNVTRKNVGGNDPCAGKSIFLPAAGLIRTDLGDVGSWGDYWSSSVYTNSPQGAWSVYFDLYNLHRIPYSRCMGLSVRPVAE